MDIFIKIVLTINAIAFIYVIYKHIKQSKTKIPLNRYIMEINKIGCMYLVFYLDDEELEDNVIYFHTHNPFFECPDSIGLLSSSLIEKLKNGKVVEFNNKFEKVQIRFKKI